MYYRALVIFLLAFLDLVHAQPKDTSYYRPDTVYIKEPPVIIKKQVLIADTISQEPKGSLPISWYVAGLGSMDKGISTGIQLGGQTLRSHLSTSYEIALGTEIGNLTLQAGLGQQFLKIREESDILRKHYWKDSTIRIDTVVYPNGEKVC
jgi:hypothetical protein